ncbi:MAG: metabolite traffic protein EboE [Akkermansiaceae bacterium]
MKFHHAHLAYCTNIHPAETWQETFAVLKTHTLAVRDQVLADPVSLNQWQQSEQPKQSEKNELNEQNNQPYAIGLRLSALAADELLSGSHLQQFKTWLAQENCYVFTINGFPYGSFHGTSVKENVYLPDWSSSDRLDYTKKLFRIIAQLVPEGVDGSVSTLPASFKEFHADEDAIFNKLADCAEYIEELSKTYKRDLHLGIEPEPLGHFENTDETLAFFDRFFASVSDPDLVELIKRRIGINYDTCHFALEFDDCHASLDALRAAGLRISKIHLSSAIALDPTSPDAIAAIRAFDEPTYLHQVIVQQPAGSLTRFRDLPDFLENNALESPRLDKHDTGHDTSHNMGQTKALTEARIHFHIPLYTQPAPPLASTQNHAVEALAYLNKHPHFCTHFEIETYTWSVLPPDLQINIEDQIAKEYQWVLKA